MAEASNSQRAKIIKNKVVKANYKKLEELPTGY